jgi:hypothetical protein
LFHSLFDERRSAGQHNLRWIGRRSVGEAIPMTSRITLALRLQILCCPDGRDWAEVKGRTGVRGWFQGTRGSNAALAVR